MEKIFQKKKYIYINIYVYVYIIFIISNKFLIFTWEINNRKKKLIVIKIEKYRSKNNINHHFSLWTGAFYHLPT